MALLRTINVHGRVVTRQAIQGFYTSLIVRENVHCGDFDLGTEEETDKGRCTGAVCVHKSRYGWWWVMVMYFCPEYKRAVGRTRSLKSDRWRRECRHLGEERMGAPCRGVDRGW